MVWRDLYVFVVSWGTEVIVCAEIYGYGTAWHVYTVRKEIQEICLLPLLNGFYMS